MTSINMFFFYIIFERRNYVTNVGIPIITTHQHSSSYVIKFVIKLVIFEPRNSNVGIMSPTSEFLSSQHITIHHYHKIRDQIGHFRTSEFQRRNYVTNVGIPRRAYGRSSCLTGQDESHDRRNSCQSRNSQACWLENMLMLVMVLV